MKKWKKYSLFAFSALAVGAIASSTAVSCASTASNSGSVSSSDVPSDAQENGLLNAGSGKASDSALLAYNIWKQQGCSILKLNTSYTFSQLMNILGSWSNLIGVNTTFTNKQLSELNLTETTFNANATVQKSLYNLNTGYSTAVFNQNTYDIVSNDTLDAYNLNSFTENQLLGMCTLLNRWFADLMYLPNQSLKATTVSLGSSWGNYYSNTGVFGWDPLLNWTSNNNGATSSALSVTPFVTTEVTGCDTAVTVQSLLAIFAPFISNYVGSMSVYKTFHLQYYNTKSVNVTSTTLNNFTTGYNGNTLVANVPAGFSPYATQIPSGQGNIFKGNPLIIANSSISSNAYSFANNPVYSASGTTFFDNVAYSNLGIYSNFYGSSIAPVGVFSFGNLATALMNQMYNVNNDWFQDFSLPAGTGFFGYGTNTYAKSSYSGAFENNTYASIYTANFDTYLNLLYNKYNSGWSITPVINLVNTNNGGIDATTTLYENNWMATYGNLSNSLQLDGITNSVLNDINNMIQGVGGLLASPNQWAGNAGTDMTWSWYINELNYLYYYWNSGGNGYNSNNVANSNWNVSPNTTGIVSFSANNPVTLAIQLQNLLGGLYKKLGDGGTILKLNLFSGNAYNTTNYVTLDMTINSQPISALSASNDENIHLSQNGQNNTRPEVVYNWPTPNCTLLTYNQIESLLGSSTLPTTFYYISLTPVTNN